MTLLKGNARPNFTARAGRHTSPGSTAFGSRFATSPRQVARRAKIATYTFARCPFKRCRFARLLFERAGDATSIRLNLRGEPNDVHLANDHVESNDAGRSASRQNQYDCGHGDGLRALGG